MDPLLEIGIRSEDMDTVFTCHFNARFATVCPGFKEEPVILLQQLQATLRIREMILRGDLTPGQRLQETAIAEKLGISRTPVRHALPTLAAEGLLVAVGRRGYAVRIFTINEIITALDVRASLEGMAARLLTQRGVSHVLLRTLKACLSEGDDLFANREFRKGDEFAYGKMNELFHNSIVEAADNSIITGLVQRVQAIPFVTPGVIAFDNKSPHEMYDLLHYAHMQHHAIADALEKGEGWRAEALFQEHVYGQKLSMGLAQHRPGMQHTSLSLSSAQQR
jgi:GntR family transcriptional regulator, vanillate catabolism transcriptional regulator